MFVDEAILICTAGRGGKGCQSFDRAHPARPRPTGGGAGAGGSVMLQASADKRTLLDVQFQRHFKAPDGGHGGSRHKTGRTGEDLVIQVPVGTEVFDRKAGELLKDLDRVGARVLVCKGGAGGCGNSRRRMAGPGEPGEEKEIYLKLKLLADIGLVGFPNAGKSTWISRVTDARSRIGAYPFTTKAPVLGVVKFDDDAARVVADIPGIIGGAHRGKGLGLKFLQHVERTRVLLCLVDLAGVDGRNPVSDYEVLMGELSTYSEKLVRKVRLVAANKMDLPPARRNLAEFRQKVDKEIFPISAATGQGMGELLDRLREITA